MLHAVIHNKTRGLHLIEDIVTSSVFGPLRYLPPDEAWRILKKLFDPATTCWPEADKIDGLRVCFWPSQSSPRRKRRVEPDMVVSALSEGRVVASLVIEVKWLADVNNEQLAAQWLAVDKGLKRTTAHVLLAYGTEPDRKEIEKHFKKASKNTAEFSCWENRFVSVSWHELARRLNALDLSPRPLSWRVDVLSFLSEQGIIPFDGFTGNRYREVAPLQSMFGTTWFSNVTSVPRIRSKETRATPITTPAPTGNGK